jgi:hypothetical protein
LAKGQCAPFSNTYTTTTSTDAALITVTAVGVSSGLSVNAQDDAAYTCPPPPLLLPELTVATACSTQTSRRTKISYSGQICNKGGEALKKLTLVNNQPKAKTAVKLSQTTLDAGQCLPYSGSYTRNGSGVFTYTVKATALSSVGGVTEQASASATCSAGQSCSPANWINLGGIGNGWYKYESGRKVGYVFSGAKTAGFTDLANLTLIEALPYHHFNDSLQTAAARLIKQAVAALLNAAHPQINYPLKNTQHIISQVNKALTSKSMAKIEALTQTLNTYNLLGGAPAICDAIPPPPC